MKSTITTIPPSSDNPQPTENVPVIHLNSDQLKQAAHSANWQQVQVVYADEIKALIDERVREANDKAELKAQLAYEAGVETYDIEAIRREARERQIRWLIGTLEHNSQSDTIKQAKMQLDALTQQREELYEHNLPTGAI